MRAPILLDTCAAIWLAIGELKPEAAALLEEAGAQARGVGLSPMTAWEVSLLVSKRRLALRQPVRIWMENLLQTPGAFLADLPVEVLIAAHELPGDLHRDPADRILAATARTFGYRLMTRDRPLLAYAEAGHLQAIAC